MLWLRQKYPAAFNYEYPPLALNTREQTAGVAAEAGITQKAVSFAIKRHTSHTRYLFQLSQPAAFRVNLNGNPVEPVGEDHRQFAAEQLAAARVRIAELKREERLAKRKAKDSVSGS